MLGGRVTKSSTTKENHRSSEANFTEVLRSILAQPFVSIDIARFDSKGKRILFPPPSFLLFSLASHFGKAQIHLVLGPLK